MKKFSRMLVGVLAASMISLGAITAAPLAQAAPAAINIQSSSCPSVIKQGQSSGCVVELQNLLKKWGYNPGTVDGIFGANTLSAVKSFQSAKKLTVDGLVGANTKAALYASPSSVSISSAYATRTSGTTNDAYGYVVVTTGTTSKVTFQFNGNSTIYAVTKAGSLTSTWGSPATATVSSDKRNWTVTNDRLGAGTRTVTVTAYDSAGRASGTKSFTITVTTPPTTGNYLQSSACPSIIKQGQSGACVTELQNLLKKWSYNPGTVDGIFGANTLSAVKSFQSAKGLTVDGLVGANTKSALYGSVPPPPPGLGGKVVTQANATLGQNRSAFASSGDWCAAFVSKILQRAGSSVPTTSWAPDFQSSKPDPNQSYNPNIFKGHFTWVARGQTPQPGDVAIWDWNANGVANHVNIVVSVASYNSFTMIGGNQGSGDGAVTKVTSSSSTCSGSTSCGYSYGNLIGFARPIA